MEGKLTLRDLLTIVTAFAVVGTGFFFFGTVSTQLENLSAAVNGLTAQVAAAGAIDAQQDTKIAVLTGRVEVLERAAAIGTR